MLQKYLLGFTGDSENTQDYDISREYLRLDAIGIALEIAER